MSTIKEVSDYLFGKGPKPSCCFNRSTTKLAGLRQVVVQGTNSNTTFVEQNPLGTYGHLASHHQIAWAFKNNMYYSDDKGVKGIIDGEFQENMHEALKRLK